MLSIHNNLSAGAQNVTKCYRRLHNNYACLQALVNNALTWQSSCVIANNAQKQQKLFVQGHNLKVHDVIKYRQKHHATMVPQMLLIISRASQLLCDVISKSRNRLSSPSVRFTPC